MSFRIDPANPKDLVTFVQNQSPSKAPWVFDCDGTLIKGDIASLTAWALIKLSLMEPAKLPREWASYKPDLFDYSEFRKLRNHIILERGESGVYDWEALLHSGLPPKTSFDVAKFAIAEASKVGSLAYLEPTSTLAKWRGEQAWICSGSPQVCVSAVAENLSIPKERVIGTLLEEVDGIQMNRLKAPGVIWEELKREALLERGIDKPWLVAGDTMGDWQMFEMATGVCWCVVWGEYRHRGEEFRRIIKRRVFNDTLDLPEQPGFYRSEVNGKTWIFEIKGSG
jgi:phosphoserine phosphatase